MAKSVKEETALTLIINECKSEDEEYIRVIVQDEKTNLEISDFTTTLIKVSWLKELFQDLYQ